MPKFDNPCRRHAERRCNESGKRGPMWEPRLLAKDDDAQCLMERVARISGQHCSHRFGHP
jgi:hypothetical protein